MAQVAELISRTNIDNYELNFGMERSDPTSRAEFNQLYSETIIQQAEAVTAVLAPIPPEELPQQVIESFQSLAEAHTVFDARQMFDTYLKNKIAKTFGIDVPVDEAVAERYQTYGLNPEVTSLTAGETARVINAGNAAREGVYEFRRALAENPDQEAKLKAVRAEIDKAFEEEMMKKAAPQIAEEEAKRSYDVLLHNAYRTDGIHATSGTLPRYREDTARPRAELARKTAKRITLQEDAYTAD